MLGKLIAGLAISAAAMAPPVSLAAAVDGYEGYGPHMMWGGGWLGWIFGPLMMVLVIGGFIALILVLARNLGSSGHPARGPSTRPDPLDILRERFARGEIDKEEYEDRRHVLGE